MTEQESTRLLKMEDELAGRVVGQDHAVTAVAQAIRVVRVGLVAPNRPGGVFLFMGPSGVGKTELAKALADFLFGDPNEMVRLDMSEYHDKSSVNRLIGSPPGYVGHDEEGQLTKAVRTKPYCVVLLDEVEKAHPEIFDLFLQVFDDGRLTDSKGRTVNFTNTIIVMTSNLGSRELLEAGLPNEGYAGQLDTLPQQYQKALRSHFRPEFLNRVDEIIAFRSWDRKDLYGIAEIHLGHLQKNLKKSRGVELKVTPDALELLLEFGYQPQFGARPLQRAIATHLSRPLAEEMLRNSPQEGAVLLARREGDKLVFTPAPSPGSQGGGGSHSPTPTREPKGPDPTPYSGDGRTGFEDATRTGISAPQPDPFAESDADTLFPHNEATEPWSATSAVDSEKQVAPLPPTAPLGPGAPLPPKSTTSYAPPMHPPSQSLASNPGRAQQPPQPAPRSAPPAANEDSEDSSEGRRFSPLRSPKRGDE
jgi:DNA polymerase III delta prime subunit